MYVGRYAPSPTGDLHLGNALAAVVAWARARRANGRCLLRIEDLDTPRVVPGAAERLRADLTWLGLHFDSDVLVQSEHVSRYHDALAVLQQRGALYACSCSRKDLARVASAPHIGDEGPPYPGTCRDKGLPLHDPARPLSLRFRVPPGVITIVDRLQGRSIQDVAHEVGDFVVRRKDGVIAYQLAVVVDDGLQRVTEVVRGMDLLPSAHRQFLLFDALDHVPPAFAHLPLLVDETGARLSKRSGNAPELLSTLRSRGLSPQRVLGLLGAALGVCGQGEEIDAMALADRLDDDTLQRPSVVLPTGVRSGDLNDINPSGR